MTRERVSKSYTFEKMHFPDKAYWKVVERIKHKLINHTGVKLKLCKNVYGIDLYIICMFIVIVNASADVAS